MSLIYLLPAVLVVGVWTHEVIHALTVRILGGEIVEINLRSLYVDYVAKSRRHEQLVRHAPFVSGLLLLPLLWNQFTVSSEGILTASFWITVSLTGGEGEIGIVP